jgi:hypothetical protein
MYDTIHHRYFIDDDGRKQGLCTYFHPNGNVKSETTYIDDIRNGPNVEYYVNGTPYIKRWYVDNVEYGKEDCFGFEVYHGTTGETRGWTIERTRYNAEMKAFGDALEDRLVAWFIVARRLNISRDITKIIGRYALDSMDPKVAYYLNCAAGRDRFVF